MGIAGAYLLYLAWQLLQSLHDTETTMSPVLAVLFAVLFGGAGAALQALSELSGGLDALREQSQARLEELKK